MFVNSKTGYQTPQDCLVPDKVPGASNSIESSGSSQQAPTVMPGEQTLDAPCAQVRPHPIPAGQFTEPPHL